MHPDIRLRSSPKCPLWTEWGPEDGQLQLRLRQAPPGSGRRLTEGLEAELFTILLGCLVVLFAHQPPVLHEVELVARGQLPVADDAGEAVQVVDEVLCLADHLGWGDALLAGRAFCAEAPVRTRMDQSTQGCLDPLDSPSPSSTHHSGGSPGLNPWAAQCLPAGPLHLQVGSWLCAQAR